MMAGRGKKGKGAGGGALGAIEQGRRNRHA